MKHLAAFLMMFLVSVTLMAQVAIAPAAGDGTEQNPYEIASLENLYWIAASDDVVPNPDQEARWSSHYVQTADIDASDTINWFDGQGWTPIGNFITFSDNQPFIGSFNGQNHSIDSLFIYQPDTSNVGLFGYTEGAPLEYLNITNVNITGDTMVGGLVGRLKGYSILSRVCVTGVVSGASYVGGLIGAQQDNSIISCSYFNGSINGDSFVGGLLARQWDSTVFNSYYNYEEVLINNENVITTGALDNLTFNTWLNNDLHLDIDDYLSYDGTCYLINSVDDLKKLLAFGQFEGYPFKLTADLDLEGYSNFYIPYFAGTFDGSGFVIENFTLDMIDYNFVGLFGYTIGSTIENLGIMNYNISGNNFVGGLVGMQIESNIFNSYTSGNVNGTGHCVGGIAGVQENSMISTCYSIGNVSSILSDAGGLVGFQRNNSIITNSYSIVNVSSGSWFVGGIIGWQLDSAISDCYSSGVIQGFGDVGGLIGYQLQSTVTNSYWNTETSGQTESAGGEGRTTDEMTYPYAANTYVDWDFDEIWNADVDFTINQGYPYLQEMPVSVDKEVIAVIESPKLSNFPNPFNPETTISFILPQDTAKLELKIYNIRGQLVRTLISGTPYSKGEHQIVWDGRNDSGKTSASGVYFYRLTTPNFTQQNKMLLLK